MAPGTSHLTQEVQSADPVVRVRAVVPFLYDLGGRVVDFSAACAALKGLADVVGPVERDSFAVRSWNLSYLAGHAPTLRCDLAPGTADLSGVGWDFTRVLRVYPWLGVVSIEYTFQPPADDLSVAGFYDALVAWKNRDYLPYLDKEGALSTHLANHLGWRESETDLDLHSSVIGAVRASFREAGAIEFRPQRYAFHDFRPCFVIDGPDFGQAEIESLLLLSESSRESEDLADVEKVSFRGVTISSTGWSTVLIGDSSDHGDSRAVLDLLGTIHAQWFLCQAWISVSDTDTVTANPGGAEEEAEELARTQLNLARDLVEVDNLDLMLKDPALLRVARSLSVAFSLRDHRWAAERRLKVLDDYSRQVSEITQARDAQRLQILFSLSAAGTIAGLIPAIASQQSSWGLAFATIVVGLTLWIGFAVNFALLLKRSNAARRSRKARSSIRGPLKRREARR